MSAPAETVYLFRQPLMRDAAYQLQVPSDRARLHQMALEILEAMFDGPPPEPAPDQWGELKCEPHAIDPVSADLAEHVRGIRAWESDAAVAAEESPADSPETTAVTPGTLLARELLYARRAAEYAETQFDNADAVRLWQRLAEIVEEDNPSTAAEALRRAAVVLDKSGRATEAEPLLARARSIAAEAGDRRAEGMALGNLAIVYWQTGRMEEAERTHERALAIFRETGNRRFEGTQLSNLAILYRDTGRIEKAERTYVQALAIHRETGNRRTEGVALGNLAIVYKETGRMEEAERTHERALAIFRETGNRRFEGLALGNLAGVYQETGRMEESERTYKQALMIHREVGNLSSEGTALGNLAGTYLDSARLEKAEVTYERALAIHRETRNRRFEGTHTCEYALCLLALKQADPTRSRQADAREVWQTGAAILKELGDAAALEGMITSMREACARAGVAAFDA